ncbi:hypothetical protein [Halorussus caseinilyticus]|uniref:Uncharacterized protein n=1 Tax=Halorussus caseinilyticus TaxID=3034025 RepID=A0ABD5WJF0_9EURY
MSDERDAGDDIPDEKRRQADGSDADPDADEPDADESDPEGGDAEGDTDSKDDDIEAPEVENTEGEDEGADEADTEGGDEDHESDTAENDAGPDSLEISDEKLTSAGVTVGEYDWEEFKDEFFYEDGSPPTNWRGKALPSEPSEYLGHDPDETDQRVEDGVETAEGLSAYFEDFLDPEKTPVALGEYLWEHFRYEYYYDESEEGMALPRDESGEVVPFDRSKWHGHDDFPASVFEAGWAVTDLSASFEEWLDPATTPVTKGEYYWEHFKYEYYYTDTASPPRSDRATTRGKSTASTKRSGSVSPRRTSKNASRRAHTTPGNSCKSRTSAPSTCPRNWTRTPSSRPSRATPRWRTATTSKRKSHFPRNSTFGRWTATGSTSPTRSSSSSTPRRRTRPSTTSWSRTARPSRRT